MKTPRRSRSNQTPLWIPALVIAVTLLIAFRMTASIGDGGMVALRTYAFWALVCAPVAHLGDILIRTVLDYRFVRLAVARVRSRR